MDKVVCMFITCEIIYLCMYVSDYLRLIKWFGVWFGAGERSLRHKWRKRLQKSNPVDYRHVMKSLTTFYIFLALIFYFLDPQCTHTTAIPTQPNQ